MGVIDVCKARGRSGQDDLILHVENPPDVPSDESGLVALGLPIHPTRQSHHPVFTIASMVLGTGASSIMVCSTSPAHGGVLPPECAEDRHVQGVDDVGDPVDAFGGPAGLALLSVAAHGPA